MLNKLFFLLLSLMQLCCYSQSLNYSKETEFGNFFYSENDIRTINDLIKTAEANLPRICDELNFKPDHLIITEIFPSQEEYNRNIINPDLKNTPAISGNGKIQIVSPLAKIKADNLKYEDRLLLFVHEYVHILIDKPDKSPPLFIDEGIACFYSSYDYYKSAAKKYVKQINFIPDIKQLSEHYSEIPAPDLFSFLFIDFLVQLNGRKILSEILRRSDFPANRDMEKSWKEFVERNYY